MEIMLISSLVKLKTSLLCMVGNMERVMVQSTCHVDAILILALPSVSRVILELSFRFPICKMGIIIMFHTVVKRTQGSNVCQALVHLGLQLLSPEIVLRCPKETVHVCSPG